MHPIVKALAWNANVPHTICGSANVFFGDPSVIFLKVTVNIHILYSFNFISIMQS